MSQVVVYAAGLAAGLLVGFVLHELAHWAVLKLTGYDATLSLWPPAVDGFELSTPTPTAVRLAAIAPALLGLVVAAIGGTASLFEAALFPVVVGAVSRLLWLSPQDRDIAFGGLMQSL